MARTKKTADPKAAAQGAHGTDGDAGRPPRTLAIDFQNENLIARVGSDVLAVVPAAGR